VRVFDAWIDPEQACRFLFVTPGGEMVRCEIDARVGGSFHIVEKREGVPMEHIGVFLELTRPRRLSFLYRVPYYTPQSSRVSIAVLAMEGGCELVLTHDGVAEATVARTEEGWRAILEGLDEVLSRPSNPETAD
jgi:uncharacterized protein YndB with AHSA1/START domain